MALRASVLRRAASPPMSCTLQDIFVQHFPAYAATRKLHPREWRAASCISQCYTPALGSHLWHCADGHFHQLVHHACHHRSCPRCAQPAATRWVNAQQSRLLPCPHHHAVFTLPHALLPLWEFNRRAMAQLFFDCVRSTLLSLLADPRRLGAMPGILMSLHTWGRNLSRHPHIHCLITAGGLSSDQRWINCPDPLLLPHAPLRCLLRGKFLGTLNQMLRTGSLKLPAQQDRLHWHRVIRKLYATHWNLQIQPAYAHATGVAIYLARYAKGGPIPNDRPLHCANSIVRMPYTDHRTRTQRWLSLPVHEFISRVLWHAPDRAMHTIRYAGLYSTARRTLHDAACIALAARSPAPWPRPGNAPASPPNSNGPATLHTPHLCPICCKPLARLRIQPAHQSSEFYKHMPAAPPAAPPPSTALPARLNPSFNATANGVPPGPRDRSTYHRPRGPGVTPSAAR